ncbi:tetratricopeptide repeat domain protein [Beauveria bassiana ARSEF 2860]|uniref:Tetratricopeptide repeat domain protein n=1 Tax=Beauveria bassiana (strain ARSEF 2860) TaxID=655819 RepID=J5JTN2_BEAB2|nr:tetratricopeptide repeat domain protein [Beauveria bassiana ARSEF 2860]EJP68193.1 tetratricopeptide repeat domain protein [Beauveria bassiana ARSEF 2860]
MAYMKRHFSEYPVAIWLNARDEMALKQSFARAAEMIQRLDPSLSYLSAALESRDLDEIWTAAKRWLEEPMNNRWIVTYDNYDDPLLDNGAIIGRPSHNHRTDPKPKFQGHDDGFDLKAFDIRPYFPTANHGSIIVTTRSSAVNFGPSMKIGKLRDANDSLEILAQTSGRKNFKEGHADRLLEYTINMEVADGTPWAFHRLGTLYSDQGRLREAETTYKRALDGCDAWDPKHTLTLRTINNLGILYTNQDRLREAEAMYKRALDVYEKALGPNHTLALRTVNNLGTLYVD